MTYCPECGSSKIDEKYDDRMSDPRGDWEHWDCVCTECGCEFIERTERKKEVTKHGTEWREHGEIDIDATIKSIEQTGGSAK